MKKLILVLMPLSLLFALFGFYLNKDLEFSNFLNSFNTLEFTEFDFTSIKDAFYSLDISNNWTNISQVWGQVDDLFSFFDALSDTFNAFFKSLGDIFLLQWSFVQFFFQFTGYMFGNLFTIIRFLFDFLFS